MAALAVFLLCLIRFTVFQTLANSGHDISQTDLKNLISRVTNLEMELREEKDRHMKLERGITAMAKLNEETINSLKMDFNEKITLLHEQVRDLEAVCAKNIREIRPTVVKPISKRKDNVQCRNNKCNAVQVMFSKFCQKSNKRSGEHKKGLVERQCKKTYV
jgi:hypothetical protein